MSTFTSLPPPSVGLYPQAARWGSARPAVEFTDSARVFGFTANDHAARTLTVVPASSSNAAALQARFIDCLFTRT